MRRTHPKEKQPPKRPKPAAVEDNRMDYNGTGEWSVESVLRRYREYAAELGIAAADLSPDETVAGERCWVYPVMDRVIEAIETGDSAAVRIGIEFIEQDGRFPFGRIIKSNTARALRRASLSPEQEERVRRRVAHMLAAGHVPREYREYAKLLRKIGLGEWLPFIEAHADRDNPYVLRYYDYFRRHAGP